MMMNEKNELATSLDEILSQYKNSFSNKIYNEENDDHDLLMDLFGITPDLKRENRQYWGRELGMCWQRMVVEICQHTRDDFTPALRFGADEPCDLTVADIAIDTKYRIGSGDSGTLKKFKYYGPLLREKGYTPVFLIIREDNLPAAMTACRAGLWEVYTGENTYRYLMDLTGFDIKKYLLEQAQRYSIRR